MDALPAMSGAGRNLEGKGGTSPPQSDGSEWNTGPHVPKRNVRSRPTPTPRDLTTDQLASAKVSGQFRVGAGGVPHAGRSSPPPSQTHPPNWTLDRLVVDRHPLLRVERRPGCCPVVTLITRNRQSAVLATEMQVSDSMTPVAISFLFLYLRVPSSSPSVSRRFGDLHGPGIALPCAQRVAQQFLNFLPLPQGQ